MASVEHAVKAGERAPRHARPRERITLPADAARAAGRVTHAEQETFVVLCIDIHNTLLCAPVVIALGTAHSVEVHPRDVFRAAIRNNAAGIVLAHNHPSGNPTPSAEDLTLTRRLVDVGGLVGIPVVDHVVLGESGTFVSIKTSAPEAFAK